MPLRSQPAGAVLQEPLSTLAERFGNAPIYWANCPYVRFQNR